MSNRRPLIFPPLVAGMAPIILYPMYEGMDAATDGSLMKVTPIGTLRHRHGSMPPLDGQRTYRLKDP